MDSPVKTQPPEIFLDGIDIFLLFLFRVGVIQSEVAPPAVLVGQAKVDADSLDVSDMQIAIRLGWEPCDNGIVGNSPICEVVLYDTLQKIERCLFFDL